MPRPLNLACIIYVLRKNEHVSTKISHNRAKSSFWLIALKIWRGKPMVVRRISVSWIVMKDD